ncbi:MAG TPA: hypothetical protein DEV81_21050 [Cyanobacteria bacterium UBA11049]|nr:hypothetical protein [Cyanobacteria bacterium UBA11049]
MSEFFHNFLATRQFIPHGHCYLWKPGLVWLHILSDSLIAFAYYSIPVMLVYFVYKRRDLPFNWMFLMFGSFIIACGTTHLMEIWTLWHPTYWLSGFLKAITAFVSVGTAVELVSLIPQALALPSPAQLEAANIALEKEISDRKQVEAALHKEQQFLKVLLENIEAGIVACDVQGILTVFNQAFREFQGLPEQPLSTEEWGQYYNLYLPDGKTPMQKEDIPLFRALQGECVSNVEMTMVPKHSTARTLLASGRAFFDPQGKKLGAVVVMHDITQRKQAEVTLRQSEEKNRILNAELERRVNQRTAALMLANQELANEISDRKQAQKALQQSEERFRQLAEKVRVIPWEADACGKFTYVGPQTIEILGYPLSDWYGDNFWVEHIHPEDREYALKYWLENSALLDNYEFEYRMLAADGRTIWLYDIVNVVRGKDEPQLLRGFMIDITERKRVEEELRQSEERFRATFNSAAVGIAHASLDGKWLLVNQKLCNIVGYTQEELLEKTARNLIHPDGLYVDIETVRQVIANEIQACSMEKRYICKDGSPVWVNLTISAVRKSSGEPKYFIVIIEDISKRKQAEDQIKASLKEKEVLLKEIHHRVKNNLQIISSLLNLQSGYIEDPKILEILKASENRVISMALVHEQLYLSKDLAQIDSNTYIKDLASNLFSSYNINIDAVELKVNLAQFLLSADTAITCGLIINELISNALKYAFPSGAGEIRINFEPDKQGQIILSISDNGIGLPEEFDLQNTESLGLQIVAALTNQLQGELELHKTYGTEFRIKFPE